MIDYKGFNGPHNPYSENLARWRSPRDSQDQAMDFILSFSSATFEFIWNGIFIPGASSLGTIHDGSSNRSRSRIMIYLRLNRVPTPRISRLCWVIFVIDCQRKPCVCPLSLRTHSRPQRNAGGNRVFSFLSTYILLAIRTQSWRLFGTWADISALLTIARCRVSSLSGPDQFAFQIMVMLFIFFTVILMLNVLIGSKPLVCCVPCP
jgi:hypothetical protein